MDTRSPFPLMNGYSIERDPYINSENNINLYCVPSPTSKEGKVMVPASGFENPTTIGTQGIIRAMAVFKNKLYVVVHDELYEIDSAFTITFRGTLMTDTGYVGIAKNQTQIGFVDGANMYVWDTVAASFTTVTFGFTITPIDITALDQYALVADSGSNFVYFSAIGDMTTWNSLDNFPLQGKADTLKGIRVLKSRIFIFGNFYIATRYNSGAANLPFKQDVNAFIEHGVASPSTIQVAYELMFYVGRNLDGPIGVFIASGLSNPEKISTDAIDLILQSVSDLSTIKSILYNENSIIFYQLTFPAENLTLVYVVQTRQWHQLMMPDGSEHPATSHAFFNNIHYLGMSDENKIYRMSYKFLTYRNELIRCIKVSAPFYDENNRRIRLSRFEIESIPGIYEYYINRDLMDVNSQLDSLVKTGNKTEIILFISRDGGRTYKVGKKIPYSSIGQYQARAIWRRLGCERGRRFVFKIEYPYKTHFYILGANISYEVMQS